MKPAEWSIGLGRDFPAFFEMPSELLDPVSNFTGHARGRPLRRDPGARDNSGDTRSPGLLRSIAGSLRWGSAANPSRRMTLHARRLKRPNRNHRVPGSRGHD